MLYLLTALHQEWRFLKIFTPFSPNSMGSPAIQCLSQFRFPISHNYFAVDLCISSRVRRWCCFAGGRSGGSRWDLDNNANPNRGSRFSDGYVTDDFDEEGGFAFRDATKQRAWWSDDLYAEDDEEDEGFGVLEASIAFKWVSKVFRAFGWMIPAVIISLVMGTGPDSIIMALALPLAQSALSLAADTLWGRPDETPRPRPKRKKRPFGGGANRSRVRKERDVRSRTRKEVGNYKSWFESNNVEEKENRNRQSFGGWDELDYQVRTEEEAPARPFEQGNEAREQVRVKISRRAKGGTPLFMRLLIAMFPFLGFWTKLF